MSVWIIAQRPVSGVDRPSLAEARRALQSQGRSVDDEHATKLLWAARALPVALDALSDTRAGVRLDELQVQTVSCLRYPDIDETGPGTLHAVGVHAAGTDRVEVRFVDSEVAASAEAIREQSVAIAELRFTAERVHVNHSTDDAEDAGGASSSSIAVTRFVHGPVGVKADGGDS